tara:strand:- start:433 stop:762 length:330 start_codon:yes stop_codon:yes gene_type:complete
MSINLLLANAIQLELRNILKSLELGTYVKYKDDTGYISFVGDEYITLCTHETPNPDALHGKTFCNVLIYAKDWEDIEIDESLYPKNVRNYHGKIVEHPGNELLPPIEER